MARSNSSAVTGTGTGNSTGTSSAARQLSTLTSTSERYTEEARSMAAKFGFSDFESWLTTGGDDRSLILEGTGANKYHIKPRPILTTQIFRGSCTGNPPTRTGYDAAKALYDDLLQGDSQLQSSEKLDVALRDVFEQQRKRLAEYLELPPGTEIILCPSGSDAEYIPIAIAKALHPNKKIVNGITQLNEIGAGTAPASTGKYFSTYAPFLGRVPEENGDAYLAGYDGIEGVVIDARDKDGTAIDASEAMDIYTQTQLALNNYPIVLECSVVKLVCEMVPCLLV